MPRRTGRPRAPGKRGVPASAGCSGGGGGVGAWGLPLIGLPPYSPELNPAERVLQELRRAIEGKVYPTLADKVAAVEAAVAKLEADPAQIRSLAGWDWINAAVERLPAAHAA